MPHRGPRRAGHGLAGGCAARAGSPRSRRAIGVGGSPPSACARSPWRSKLPRTAPASVFPGGRGAPGFHRPAPPKEAPCGPFPPSLPCFRRLAAPVVSALLLVALATTPAAAQVDPGIFGAIHARNIGPTGMSGRVGAIDAVDANPDILYVGAATGGLWKSVNGGVTWMPLTDSLPAASIGAIAIDQPNPDVVWIGTGERNRRNSAGVGTGRLQVARRAAGRGPAWGSRRPARSTPSSWIPRDADVVYVGALGNTWKDSEERGVYKTTDGGRRWRKILYVNPRTGAGDMVMDPSNPNHLIVGMWEHRRWPWFFESGGPGKRHLHDLRRRRELEAPRAGGRPPRRRARPHRPRLRARGSPTSCTRSWRPRRASLLRSEDGGDSWTVVNRTNNIDGRPFYYGQMRVDPTNENHVWIVESPVNESTDGGKTFTHPAGLRRGARRPPRLLGEPRRQGDRRRQRRRRVPVARRRRHLPLRPEPALLAVLPHRRGHGHARTTCTAACRTTAPSSGPP